MAIDRCADCGNQERLEKYRKECPYCERCICPSCVDKQAKIFSWNGCDKCCIDYRRLVHK